MKVAIVGSGPGGLYLAALIKAAEPGHEIHVFERNDSDDTCGFRGRHLRHHNCAPTPRAIRWSTCGWPARGVVRPANVFGEGGGLLTMLTTSARERGAARYIGSGRNVWNMVHVRDLATLYAAALARAAAGDVFNGAAEPACAVSELATAASRGAGAGGRTESWPLDEARAELGQMADALALNLRLSAGKARAQIGWTPGGPSVLDDLESGSYAAERSL